jgi:two component transcriptional regulator
MEKMDVAKQLLTTTNLPITSISGHAGYANYSNFTRSFKQIVGCTPTEYRELEKNDEK